MMRWSPGSGISVYRAPSGNANGNTVDTRGRLVTCEHSGRRVCREEADGTIVTIVDSYQGKRLNSPNDVVVKSDGSIWFTDPDYGIRNADPPIEKEQPENYVFRVAPESGEIEIAANGFEMPNGLAFAPDESVLYVADSGNPPTHIRAFDVVGGRRLTNDRVFAEVSPGVPDGFRVDEDGRIFTSAADGIQVFSSSGELLGKVLCPESPSNCTFGGVDGRTLFVTARTSVYRIDLATAGATAVE
jgi:gluconolactonase